MKEETLEKIKQLMKEKIAKKDTSFATLELKQRFPDIDESDLSETDFYELRIACLKPAFVSCHIPNFTGENESGRIEESMLVNSVIRLDIVDEFDELVANIAYIYLSLVDIDDSINTNDVENIIFDIVDEFGTPDDQMMAELLDKCFDYDEYIDDSLDYEMATGVSCIANIQDLFVNPYFRGLGIGKYMLDNLNYILKRGIGRTVYLVTTCNVPFKNQDELTKKELEKAVDIREYTRKPSENITGFLNAVGFEMYYKEKNNVAYFYKNFYGKTRKRNFKITL